MIKKFYLAILLLLCLALPLGPSAFAATFENLVVFGDSLSDNGNVARFTDGPIWVESLAGHLNANLFDFAYGGATTGNDNPAIGSDITGLQWQVGTFLSGSLSLNMDYTLFSVWAGANDFLQSRDFGVAASNIGTALQDLYSDGARDILVGNLPDIGLTPSFFGTALQGTATGWTLGFNTALDDVLSGFASTHEDANLNLLDAYGIFDTYAPGTQEWLDLFWIDGFHPSETGHSLIFETAAAAIGSPVPEPATMLLFGVGLLGIAGVSRRRNKSAPHIA